MDESWAHNVTRVGLAGRGVNRDYNYNQIERNNCCVFQFAWISPWERASLIAEKHKDPQDEPAGFWWQVAPTRCDRWICWNGLPFALPSLATIPDFDQVV